MQKESDEWIQKYGLVHTGLVAAVTSAGNLPCHYVIHVVGPTNQDAHLLGSAAMVALRKADELQCKSVALPAISSGIFGFPLPQCAQILVTCGIEFARQRPRFLRRIAFTNIDLPTVTAMADAFSVLQGPSAMHIMPPLTATGAIPPTADLGDTARSQGPNAGVARERVFGQHMPADGDTVPSGLLIQAAQAPAQGRVNVVSRARMKEEIALVSFLKTLKEVLVPACAWSVQEY